MTAIGKMQARAGFLATLVLLPFLPVAVFGQAKVYSRPYPLDRPNCDFPQSPFLSVDTNPRGSALVSIVLCFDAPHEATVRQTLPAALGCAEDGLRLTRFEDRGLVGFDASCEIQLPRRNLRSAGQFAVEPILGVVRGTGARQLVVDVWVPLVGDSRCDPTPTTTVNFPPGARECTYNFLGAAVGPKILRFSFGYGVGEVCRIVGILGFLLLLLIGLTLWHRRRALHAAEIATDFSSPILKSRAYEKVEQIASAFPNIVILGAWIWIEAILRLHTVKFVGFLLLPSNWNSAIAGIVGSLLLMFPLVITDLVCLWLWSPVRDLRHQIRG
jgi:hypothetical protein